MSQSLHHRIIWPVALTISGASIGVAGSVGIYTAKGETSNRESLLPATGNFFNEHFVGERFVHPPGDCFAMGGTCLFGAAMTTLTLFAIGALVVTVIMSGFYDHTGLWMKIVAPIIGVLGLAWLILPWVANNYPLGARALLGAIGLIGLSCWILLETYGVFPKT